MTVSYEKILIDNSEKCYKNRIDDENRYQKEHPTAEHAKIDDSESSNDGDNDNYVVYGYVKNEKAGTDGDDSESDSKDKENDQECMNFPWHFYCVISHKNFSKKWPIFHNFKEIEGGKDWCNGS